MMISMPMGLVRLPSSNSCVMMMRMRASNSNSSPSQPPKHHNNNINVVNLRQRRQQEEEDFVRPLANFPERIPGDRFTSFTPQDQKVHDGYTKEMEPLKEEARKMLLKECKEVDKLYLIDTIERLGISYHFEDEIEQQLQLLYNIDHGSSVGYSDLSTVALQFRLFRQHGYPISSDVFEEFTKGNGEFKKSLESDVKGLLNLYEASYVRTRKDAILDEALSFTTNKLQQMQSESESSQEPNYIEKLVKHALYQSVHRGNPRIEAHHFITVYEENEDRNMLLLKMAKLDFNSLQLLYRKELSETVRWWKEFDFDPVTKIPYARNRLVECYFFAVALLFQPKYSVGRLAITKFLTTGCFIDDTYDAFGTIDELEVFTDSIQRWDVGDADRFPEYMKNAYTAFMKAHEEVEQYTTQVGRPHAFHYLKEAWKEYARRSIIQSRWFLSKDEEKLPSFDEYLANGLGTTAGKVTSFAYFMAMESATEDVFEWFFNDPPIHNTANIIFRLINDVSGHHFEKERGAFTPIDIYMKEFKVSEEEAKRRMMEMAEDAYKDFNEECCRKQKKKMMPLTREMLSFVKTLTFHMDVFYKNGVDGWIDSENAVKPYINRMFMVPFTI